MTAENASLYPGTVSTGIKTTEGPNREQPSSPHPIFVDGMEVPPGTIARYRGDKLIKIIFPDGSEIVKEE